MGLLNSTITTKPVTLAKGSSIKTYHPLSLGYLSVIGCKSRIGHKKCNKLLKERKVTNLEIFQHSSYCVHFKYIKVYISVKVILQGY